MKKDVSGVFGVIILVIIVAGIFVGYSFLNKNTIGIEISCMNGDFIGFKSFPMPAMCMACTDYCNGEINVKDDDSNIIWHNTYKSDSFESVWVPCPELNANDSKNLIIDYKTSSPQYGNFSNKIEKIYKK